ncbi:hypothetical protein B0H13DRAFT_2155165 [Mycena leptocephala]|nr:hypothetical protein B0H13DRAFT_2155165 [Mycena leptocephala]
MTSTNQLSPSSNSTAWGILLLLASILALIAQQIRIHSALLVYKSEGESEFRAGSPCRPLLPPRFRSRASPLPRSSGPCSGGSS